MEKKPNKMEIDLTMELQSKCVNDISFVDVQRKKSEKKLLKK